MSDQTKDGGDISSGFGESEVDGPVSDEKAEQMLHADEKDQRDGSDRDRRGAGGGGGGGAW